MDFNCNRVHTETFALPKEGRFLKLKDNEVEIHHKETFDGLAPCFTIEEEDILKYIEMESDEMYHR